MCLLHTHTHESAGERVFVFAWVHAMAGEEPSGAHMKQKWLTEISFEFIHPMKQWKQYITRE